MYKFKQIDVHELHHLLGKINLIEIRESCEINGGKIPTSEIVVSIGIQLNHEVFLNKQNTYYIACLSDYQNYKLVTTLHELGYKVVNVIGGTKEYEKHYPLEKINKTSC
jgi:rhodanese-related sulfurtransferase